MGHPPPHAQTTPAGRVNGDVSAEVSHSVDDLISGAASEAAAKAAAPPAGEPIEKPAKKEKSKTRMIYSDETTSPEEKMAQLPRYAFVPARKETALGELPGAVVVGTIRESEYPTY